MKPAACTAASASHTCAAIDTTRAVGERLLLRHEVGQRPSVEQLHDQRVLRLSLARFEDVRDLHDVGMADQVHGARLGKQPAHDAGKHGIPVDDLHGGPVADANVLDFEHAPGGPFAEQTHDPVGANRVPRDVFGRPHQPGLRLVITRHLVVHLGNVILGMIGEEANMARSRHQRRTWMASRTSS